MEDAWNMATTLEMSGHVGWHCATIIRDEHKVVLLVPAQDLGIGCATPWRARITNKPGQKVGIALAEVCDESNIDILVEEVTQAHARPPVAGRA